MLHRSTVDQSFSTCPDPLSKFRMSYNSHVTQITQDRLISELLSPGGIATVPYDRRKHGEANMARVLAEKRLKPDMKVPVEDLSDEDLLERFLKGDGFESQEAFRTLVVRHGPMVLGVCRHVLHHETDAEDAFQATFLMLSRKGASIRNRNALSGWLHEVAHRIACRARAKKVRRTVLERQSMAMLRRAIQNDDPQETAILSELRPFLHEEVNRLPRKFAIPIILSYLEGKTNEEVAELLQWPIGTVKGRLSHARELLRRRLLRRGMALSVAFLMTALSRGMVFAEVVPAELINRTVALAGRFSRRSGPLIKRSSSAHSRINSSAVSLANDYQARFGFGYLKYRALLAIVFLSMAIGIGLAVSHGANSSFLRALSAHIPSRGISSSCH
jgi:RNA polymerase sigma factor (sigma-70 family)